jgi:Rps23 Pro-64 3,4-dihydroxylase Tpa1-like proline 4-hydroxylase
MEVLQTDRLDVFNKSDNLEYFGDWTNDINTYKKAFTDGKPFKNVVIPNFLNESVLDQISSEFPNDFEDNKDWFHYNNPLEVKYLNSNIENFPKTIKNLYYALSTEQIVKLFSGISSIDELERDPTLYGCSLHAHGNNGRLNLHLDYEKHPLLENKERRLNLILYLNKEWKREWNGETELWNDDVTECITKHPITYNSALLFQTNDISWHGVPEKIKCPQNEYRKTLAYYYISPLVSQANPDKYGVDSDGYRTKASFIKRPQDVYRPQLEKFYDIRPHRRITQKDIDIIWPEWTSQEY